MTAFPCRVQMYPLRETYDGASADTAGYFSFKTTETGKQTLVVSFVGYKTVEKDIDLSAAR